jgi:hypothetical protein
MVEQRRPHPAAHAPQQELAAHTRGNGGDIPPAPLAETAAEVDRLARELAHTVDEINEHGAQVKDPEEGLIDFPALRHGETVLLCWKLGEDEIRYWHTLAGGFAGRQELPLE